MSLVHRSLVWSRGFGDPRSTRQCRAVHDSKRAGEKHSVPIYLDRGDAAVLAAMYLEDRIDL